MKNQNECFIKFNDCKNNYRETKKDFKTYEDAMQFMTKTFDKVNSDFISFY